MKSESPAVLQQRAETLLRALKGVQDARVQVDATGRLARIVVMCPPADERTTSRNVQTALFAVLGVAVDPGVLVFNAAAQAKPAPVAASAPVAPQPAADPQVLDIGMAARKSDLNDAARVAFDTLRAAQSNFHGFVFEGAELVRINGMQYVVVSVHRQGADARYCGAAPVIDSVNAASARALMNAVGVAAMGSARDYAAQQHLETVNA
jgi:hypothetical protein